MVTKKYCPGQQNLKAPSIEQAKKPVVALKIKNFARGGEWFAGRLPRKPGKRVCRPAGRPMNHEF
jgi:hypothetical protein